MKMHKISEETTSSHFKQINNMEENEYLEFLAELYWKEDEFWKEIYEDMEAERWIEEDKNNF